jgi:lectin, mannose-binding 2
MGTLAILLSTLITLAASQFSLQNDFTLTQPLSNAKEKFDVFGSATLYSDIIVLTPNSPHMSGAIWSKKTNPHKYWQAEFSLRVSGAERGGQGLAFWYAAKPGRSGNVFGNADQWDGLGLFFDANSGGKVLTSFV